MTKRARQALGLTQAEFAKLLDVGKSTVERWESAGATGTTLALMAIIAEHPRTALKILRRLAAGESFNEAEPAADAAAAGSSISGSPPPPSDSTKPQWPGIDMPRGPITTAVATSPVKTPAVDASSPEFAGPPPPSGPRPMTGEEQEEVRRWGNQ